IDMLSGLSVRIRAPRGFQEAQATSGGVSTDEIDPKSMESKLVKSLFFAGEVLDVAGDCGGFNLQFAFSSGYAAGLGASAD
ncbi:MAG TPA: NAD(P)/FAD-dependent oxidoreductase, partial [bacterium]|nr:NAD(P)/FAD-dependent oxidoreductase [bacterium]